MAQGLPRLRRCPGRRDELGVLEPSVEQDPGGSQRHRTAGVPLGAEDPSSCWKPQQDPLGAAGSAWSSRGLAKALLGSVLGVLGTELGWSRLHSLQDKSLSDSFPMLQAGPGAADGAEASGGVRRGKER